MGESTTNRVPLPSGLRHLAVESTRPVHLSRDEVARIVEFWGFTKSGVDFVRKLERCATLERVDITHQRGVRYRTEQVLAVYGQETGSSSPV